MRHKVKTKKIGKDLKHKKAILKNLALSFLKKEKVTTTVTKAKIFKSFIEKIITRAKEDTLHNRRMVYKKIKDTSVLKKLFVNIAKRYQNRNGGYTSLYKLGKRKGDASEMALLQLVPELIETNSSEKKEEKRSNVENNKK